MKKLLGLLALLTILSCQTLVAYEYHGPETELIALINNERAANGVPPLTTNWEAARLARYKTEEMRAHQHFGHESLFYGNPAETLVRFYVCFDAVGANIALGHETAQDVLAAWINAPGHHANLINPIYTSAGVGLSWDDDGIPYWTIILIRQGPT